MKIAKLILIALISLFAYACSSEENGVTIKSSFMGIGAAQTTVEADA